jgi:5-methylcytosine-specific restriction protein A
VRTTGPSRKVRDLVLARDEAACIVCGLSESLQLHHRRPRGMGGTRRDNTNSPACLVTLCFPHHQAVESERTFASLLGLLVAQQEDPSTVPLRYQRRWVLLTDDGLVKELP